jgi:hypothetical protein
MGVHQNKWQRASACGWSKIRRPVAGAKGRDKYLDEFFRLERRQGSSGGDCGHHSRWFFSLHAPNLKKMKYDAMRPLHVQIE